MLVLFIKRSVTFEMIQNTNLEYLKFKFISEDWETGVKKLSRS